MSNPATPQEMRDMAACADTAVVDDSGGSAQFAATATMLRHGADAVEDVARLEREAIHLDLRAGAAEHELDKATAALAALRAVIQQELDSVVSEVDSFWRIVHAAGLWPKGEQVPTATVTSPGVSTVIGNTVPLTTAVTDDCLPDFQAAGFTEPCVVFYRRGPNDPPGNRQGWACRTCGNFDYQGHIPDCTWQQPPLSTTGGEQAPTVNPLKEAARQARQALQPLHTAAARFSPDDKLHAAAALERALVDVPDMLRAEFDVVKKAIAMVKARQKNVSAYENTWLGDLLAVLREQS